MIEGQCYKIEVAGSAPDEVIQDNSMHLILPVTNGP
jgi:hypothetical protein